MAPSFPCAAANWIWSDDHQSGESNANFIFTRNFNLSGNLSKDIKLVVTADSRYRAFLNGVWIGDGPARGFPEEWFYDEYEISAFVHPGCNKLSILVTHFGTSNFQYILAQPGLLAGVSLNSDWIIATDESWNVARDTKFLQNVPRTSCQLGFEEHIDLRISDYHWSPALVLASQGSHEHKNVIKRDLSLLSRTPREIHKVIALAKSKEIDESINFHIRQMFSPEPSGCNMLGVAGLIVTKITLDQQWKGQLQQMGSVFDFSINGKKIEFSLDQDLYSANLTLDAGEHLFVISFCTRYDHNYEFTMGFKCDDGAIEFPLLRNRQGESVTYLTSGPLWTTDQLTNCYIEIKDSSAEKSTPLFLQDEPRLATMLQAAGTQTSISEIERIIGTKLIPVHEENLSSRDTYFSIRTNSYGAAHFTNGRLNQLSVPNDHCLIIDLEDMTNGYIELEFDAATDTEIGLFAFENLISSENGSFPRIQYLQLSALPYRQVSHITSKDGLNNFISKERRGFRFISLTVRNAIRPVVFKRCRVHESTYEALRKGSFESSDEQLNKMFSVAQRTLLLCMEDTFTDCPSYEQTFWVGDARNEALFASVTFSAFDLIERSCRLVARSLDRLPLAASQCPSGWDTIIPTFSYLGILMAWESYWHTANLDFLRRVYPSVRKSITNSVALCTNKGLFTAEAWHFLDWTDIDCSDDRKTVLHDSLFLLGALRAGSKMATLLGEQGDGNFYSQSIDNLVKALNDQWDEVKGAFPDALGEDGSPSSKSSIHTSILAILFDALSGSKRDRALQNIIAPREDLTPIGSPNAMFYMMEALMRENRYDLVLPMVQRFWGHMLDEGAATFWEMIYPKDSEFPTRSHCHGWSAAPAYLLPHIFFGLRCVEAGWRKVSLQPSLFGLSFVKAEICTPRGILQLELQAGAENTPELRFIAPEGIEVTIVTG